MVGQRYLPSLCGAFQSKLTLPCLGILMSSAGRIMMAFCATPKLCPQNFKAAFLFSSLTVSVIVALAPRRNFFIRAIKAICLDLPRGRSGALLRCTLSAARSEERRVGKECRSGGGGYQ